MQIVAGAVRRPSTTGDGRRGPEHRRRTDAGRPAGRRTTRRRRAGRPPRRRRAPGRLAAHPADQLAHQVAVGVGVVGVARPRAPTTPRWRPAPRSSGVQSHRSSSVSGSRMAGTPARWQRAWRTVAAALPPTANSGHTEATGSSRPTTALVDQLQQQQRHQRLAHRVHVDQRVRPPGPGAGLVGPPADQVDHDPVIDHDADAGSHLTPVGEVADELLSHSVEALIASPRDRHVHPGSIPARRASAGRQHARRCDPVVAYPVGERVRPVTPSAAARKIGSPATENPRQQASTNLTWWASRLWAATGKSCVSPPSRLSVRWGR